MAKQKTRYRTLKSEQTSTAKRKLPKEFVFSLVMVIFGGLVLLGTSYAVFTTVASGTKEHSVVAGTFTITFTEGEKVTVNNASPMSDAEGTSSENPSYTFTIRNTGTIDALYRIKLEEDTSNPDTMLAKNQVKLQYKKDGVASSILTLNQLPTGLIVVADQNLAAGASVSYDLKVWLADTATNEAQGKSFKAKIVVEAVQKTDGQFSDTTPPVVTLAGEQDMVVAQNATYSDPGVSSVVDDRESAMDTNKVRTSYQYYDGDTTTDVAGVDTSNVGVYYVSYQAADSVGNEGVAVRTVNVHEEDAVLPTITLNGPSMMYRMLGQEFIDPGYQATDAQGNDITSRVVVSGTVSSNQLGSYVIRYIAVDAQGNMKSTTRTVVLRDFNEVIMSATESIVPYTIPTTGTYQIQAWGAAGGAGASYGSRVSLGGKGAKISGNFFFNQGDELLILVGNKGTDYTNATSLTDGTTGAGGGGTFVVKRNDASSYKMNVPDSIYNGWGVEPLIIAAGGNGGGDAANEANPSVTVYHASTAQGDVPGYTSYCGGGFSTYYNNPNAGKSFLMGGAGATAIFTRPSGQKTAGSLAGFGGGGGNRDDSTGGGGGGYYGGCPGVAATSYNIGANPKSEDTVSSGNSGNGQVILSKAE